MNGLQQLQMKNFQTIKRLKDKKICEINMFKRH